VYRVSDSHPTRSPHLAVQLNGCNEMNQQVKYSTPTCGCFKEEFLVRKWCVLLANSPLFTRFIIVVIALNAVFLAIWDPVSSLYDLESVRNTIVNSSELFFQIVYTIEMFVLMIAFGVVRETNKAYFRRSWNWFDFLVVVLGWVALGIEYGSSAEASPILRIIRVLRPLRLLQYIPGLQVLNNTVVRSVEQLGDVFLLLLFTYFVLALIGLTVFRGKLHQRCGWQSSVGSTWHLYEATADRFCSLSAVGGLRCPNVTVVEPSTGLARPVVCAQVFDPPNSGLTGFDNIFQGLLTVFVFVTLEGWSEVMASVIRRRPFR